MKILFTLSILLTFISCSNQNDTEHLSENTRFLQINPDSYIQNLPGKLAENSGLIFYNDLFWTFNDSGGENKIYGFNPNGIIEIEIKIEGAKNEDWEDIAQDENHIYIGDFGNNNGVRSNQKIYKINKNDIAETEEQTVSADEINFNFANQKNFDFQQLNTPFDCEAMVEMNGNLYIFTKDWTDRTTTVYQIPKENGDYEIKLIEKFNVTGLITGADINPEKTQLALIGYKSFKPIVWLFSDISANSFFEGEKIYIEMDSIFNAQTEGVCFKGNDSIIISCEQTNSFTQQVFLIDLKTLE